MIVLATVALVQLADLATYAIALSLPYGHEGWVAAAVDPSRVVLGKVVIIAIVAGVWAFRRGRAPRGYAILVAWAVAWGILGTATNVVNGGLLGG